MTQTLRLSGPPHPFQCRCGKVAGVTRDDAKRMRRYYAQKSGTSNEVRYYQCEFNSWHWTSQLQKRAGT